jgi:hypothetical protein
MTPAEPPLDAPVDTKIDWANDCFDRERSRLFEDPSLAKLLEALKNAVHRSREDMFRAGIAGLCRECEEKEGGSCCGAGLEKHYSGLILLINRLLGVPLPRQRKESSSCFFLSSTGCSLVARHVLCINYVCNKITSRIKPDQLAALRGAEGEEILLLFQVNEKLKRLVRRYPTAEHAGNTENPESE